MCRKEPMLQKVKDTENQPEDRKAAALDSEIDDQRSEAEEDLELEPDLEVGTRRAGAGTGLGSAGEPQPEAVLLRRADERQEARKRNGENFANGILRPGDRYLAAFLVPVVIMVIIFAQRGIFPFGDESF